jgi:tryptophan synthase alpha chain
MNRLDEKFKELKKRREKAFIAYVTAGDPSLAATKEIVLALEKAGADIVELGIPFSDPLADGPTIQAASARALAKGATLKGIFAMASKLRASASMPLVFMTYYNPVLKYGVDRFLKSCGACGVDGCIIPDLPVEEAKDLIRLSKKYGVAAIFLAAPTSTKGRLKMIAKSSSGFIYYVSLTGVTGSRKKLPAEIAANVRSIKSMTAKPVAVGFGVSTPEQAREVARSADGVIVGSAIVKLIAKYGRNSVPKVSGFSKKIAGAIHHA